MNSMFENIFKKITNEFIIKHSKALKTLALCWLFNKRAFSVIGKFRQMLSDLIKTKHNSNHKLQQITL